MKLVRLFCLIILLSVFTGCGEKNIQRTPSLRFSSTSATVAIKEDVSVPFVSENLDPYDVRLDIDDFIAHGFVSDGVVKFSGKHVGEAIATISYEDLKSECRITVTGLLDAAFLATPLLKFGESTAYILANAPGAISPASDSVVGAIVDTDWRALVPSWDSAPVSLQYRFNDGKLEVVQVRYGGIRIERYNSVRSTFTEVLAERYRMFAINKWEKPGEYVIREVFDDHQKTEFSVTLWYALDDATINKYVK